MQYGDIKVYELGDHIRMRPGMYIGDLQISGYKQLLEGFFEYLLRDHIDNPILKIQFYKKNRLRISVTNIDLKNLCQALIDHDSNTKRLTELGLSVPVFLSSKITIIANSTSSSILFSGRKGVFKLTASTPTEIANTCVIDLTLDRTIFQDLEVKFDHITPFFQQFAYLNPGLKIICEDKISGDSQRLVFHYKEGVFNQMDHFISQQSFFSPIVKFEINAKINGYDYRISIVFNRLWYDTNTFKTFAGNIDTFFGGSYEDGILEGLLLAIKALAIEENTTIKINKRVLKTEINVFAAVSGSEFIYSGSTKRKLGMPELKKEVKQLVFEKALIFFKNNPNTCKQFIVKFENNED